MTDTLLASEVIRKMKDLHLERGWSQEKMQAADGSLCLIGARLMATALLRTQRPSLDLKLFFDVGREVNRYIAEAADIHVINVIGWNDAPERTFDDLMDMYDHAEKLALIAEEASPGGGDDSV